MLNTYRIPSKLYVANSEEILLSKEGTTQGDTSAMGMYACSLMPLVNSLKHDVESPTVYPKQVWYADDSAAGGKLTQIVKWWNDLQQQGPIYGYHPKPSKTWLIVKPEYLNKAKELFPSEINITTTGHRYLGSFIGNQEGLQNFINGEIEEWKKDISGLASIAANDPHLAYSAFVYGTSKRWSFVSRTTPDISGLFNPLEYHIKEEFIPAITGKLHIPDNIRRIFSLPAKMGGMGISNASETSDLEYNNSIKATLALTEALFNQADCYNENVDEQASILSSIKSAREEFFKRERANIVQWMVYNLHQYGN